MYMYICFTYILGIVYYIVIEPPHDPAGPCKVEKCAVKWLGIAYLLFQAQRSAMAVRVKISFHLFQDKDKCESGWMDGKLRFYI